MEYLSACVLLSILKDEEIAMAIRNLSTGWVLSDKEMGMESTFYPWVCYWAKS
jgi:hypothetical protein